MQQQSFISQRNFKRGNIVLVRRGQPLPTTTVLRPPISIRRQEHPAPNKRSANKDRERFPDGSRRLSWAGEQDAMSRSTESKDMDPACSARAAVPEFILRMSLAVRDFFFVFLFLPMFLLLTVDVQTSPLGFSWARLRWPNPLGWQQAVAG